MKKSLRSPARHQRLGEVRNAVAGDIEDCDGLLLIRGVGTIAVVQHRNITFVRTDRQHGWQIVRLLGMSRDFHEHVTTGKISGRRWLDHIDENQAGERDS